MLTNDKSKLILQCIAFTFGGKGFETKEAQEWRTRLAKTENCIVFRCDSHDFENEYMFWFCINSLKFLWQMTDQIGTT